MLWNLVILLLLSKGQAGSPPTVECNQDLFDMKNGTIQSPNFPQQYPANQLCNYHIKAPYGYSVTLRLKELQFGTRDPNDFLIIFDGPDCFAKRIAVYTEFSRWPITSTSEHMTALFTSDRFNAGKGFQADFSTDYDMSPARRIFQSMYFSTVADTLLLYCGGELKEESKTIIVPAYIRLPALCIWRIEAPHGHIVNVTVKPLFNFFGLSWVKVLDGNDCAGKQLAHMNAGSRILPLNVASSGTHMVVMYARFRSIVPDPPLEFSYETVKSNVTITSKPLNELQFFYAADYTNTTQASKSMSIAIGGPVKFQVIGMILTLMAFVRM